MRYQIARRLPRHRSRLTKHMNLQRRFNFTKVPVYILPILCFTKAATQQHQTVPSTFRDGGRLFLLCNCGCILAYKLKHHASFSPFYLIPKHGVFPPLYTIPSSIHLGCILLCRWLPVWSIYTHSLVQQCYHHKHTHPRAATNTQMWRISYWVDSVSSTVKLFLLYVQTLQSLSFSPDALLHRGVTSSKSCIILNSTTNKSVFFSFIVGFLQYSFQKNNNNLHSNNKYEFCFASFSFWFTHRSRLFPI